MAFDFGFNFRHTSGYVTDPAYAVPVLGTTADPYPTTFTNANGLSINAGWEGAGSTNPNDIFANTNDPRLAGINYGQNNGNTCTFHVDLSSGSVPGAGAYIIDLVFSDVVDFKLFDNAASLIDGTNGGAGTLTTGGGDGSHWLDATLAAVTATTTWTGATVTKTFSTTTVKLSMCLNATAVGDNLCFLSHFRLTLQAATATSVPRMLMLLGVGT